jgi:hypothetical protein
MVSRQAPFLASATTLALAAVTACANIQVFGEPNTRDDGGGGGSGGDGGRGGATTTSSAGGMTSCGENVPPVAGCHPDCDQCDGGVCVRVCNSFNSCIGAILTCPPGLACEVQCTDGACIATSIECPADHACTVTCTGSQSCSNATVNCGTAAGDGTCELRCEGAPDVCAGAVVSCGPNQCLATCEQGTTPPMVACGGACECVPCGG